MMNENSKNDEQENSDTAFDWRLKLTEQFLDNKNNATQKAAKITRLPTQQPTSTTYISSLSTEAMIIHSSHNTAVPFNERNSAYEDYIDREFTERNAAILKNRLSDATTLRNSSAFASQPSDSQQQQQGDLGDYFSRGRTDRMAEKNLNVTNGNNIVTVTTPTLNDKDITDVEASHYFNNCLNVDNVHSVDKQQRPGSAANDHNSIAGDNKDTEDTSDAAEPVWWVADKDEGDGFYSISGLLFLLGFLFPFFWWIGSIWPKHVLEKGGKMADRWQKLNQIMSIGFSTILLILVIVFAILYATDSV
ncbi:hypothetical protein BDF20DRAFT_889883 [Mycotypha africana]|uniref:uncharacterized protein n=1 Tax=Mycotypha africana TaxID=64632 RepID=UPI0022FFE039|nr:uncharacterized protein BDF20DRAFT_889883 [Mycotypha africana]KAI8970204.1 hypothetical protein BDF20DRAFT_889883 [Mycotypha africana]